MTDDALVLRLSPQDNVVIARRSLEAGTTVTIGGAEAVLTDAAPIGFKLAATDLGEATIVLRAGVPIGRLISAVRTGELVHIHNLESLYLRTHARGES